MSETTSAGVCDVIEERRGDVYRKVNVFNNPANYCELKKETFSHLRVMKPEMFLNIFDVLT